MIFDLGRLMIAHVSIGVGNADTSKRFCEAALEPLGCKYLRGPEIATGLRAPKYKTARFSRFPTLSQIRL